MSLTKSIRVLRVCLITSISFFSVGYIDSYTSPIEDTLLQREVFSQDSYSLFASANYLGGTFSSTIGGFISECLGIKASLIISSQLAIIGSMLLVMARDSVSMTLGRLLIGFYTGMSMSWVVVYNAEIAPDNVKKLYGAILTISLRIGVVSSYGLGVWIGPCWLALIYLVMVVFITLNFVYLPETPRWLDNKGWSESANKSKEYFYDSSQEKLFVDLNTDTVHSDCCNTNLSQKIASYFVWPVLRPLFVCCSIQLFKTSSGHEYLLAYSAHTLEESVSINPRIAALLFAVFLLFGGIIFLSLISKVKWKKLLLLTTFTQIVANGMLSLTIYLSNHTFHCNHDNQQATLVCEILQSAPLIFVALYAFSYTLGWGSIGWWLIGEVLHPHYNRVSAGIVTFVAFSCSYLNMQICPIIEEHFGSYTVFLINTVVCLFGFILQILY